LPDPQATQDKPITDDSVTDAAVEEDVSLPSETSGEPAVPEKFLRADGTPDVEAMAKSYAELEKKLSGERTDEADEGEEDKSADDDGRIDTKAQEEQVKDIVSEAGFELGDLEAQVEETGTLSEEAFTKFEEMGYPKEMVDTYVRGLKANQAIGEGIKTESYEAAGGEESYQKMIEWAGENLTEAEIDVYNDAVNSYDKGRTLRAIERLKLKYETEANVEPSVTVSGTQSQASGDAYGSEAEWMDDMADPRYQTSAAYRQKVIAKRMRSDWT